jgi:Domain of unknown function (DUF5666)
MKADGIRANRVKWIGLAAVPVICLMMAVSAFAADTGLAGGTDTLSILMDNTPGTLKDALNAIGPAVIWNGGVTVDGSTLQCAGISAEIIASDQEGGYPATRFFGFGGEPVNLEDLDLSAVHVNMVKTDEGTYVVRWIVQGPALILRGRITELDPQAKTLTVQGITVSATQYTRLRRYRLLAVNQPITFDDLKTGDPVRVVTSYANGNYLAIGILEVVPPPSNSATPTIK